MISWTWPSIARSLVIAGPAEFTHILYTYMIIYGYIYIYYIILYIYILFFGFPCRVLGVLVFRADDPRFSRVMWAGSLPKNAENIIHPERCIVSSDQSPWLNSSHQTVWYSVQSVRTDSNLRIGHLFERCLAPRCSKSPIKPSRGLADLAVTYFLCVGNCLSPGTRDSLDLPRWHEYMYIKLYIYILYIYVYIYIVYIYCVYIYILYIYCIYIVYVYIYSIYIVYILYILYIYWIYILYIYCIYYIYIYCMYINIYK